MKIVVCDVCEEQYDPEFAMSMVVIPGEWLETESGVTVDVCSPQCLLAAARQMAGQDEPQLGVAGESADQGHDEKTGGSFQPYPEQPPTFQSPVVVKTRSEHD